MASKNRSVEAMEAELRAVRENIRHLERELELMEQRERARQLPRRGAAEQKLCEATPHCQPSTDEAAVSEAGGRACVAPVAAAAGVHEPPPDPAAGWSVYSDREKDRETARECLVSRRCGIAIPGAEPSGQLANAQEPGPADEAVKEKGEATQHCPPSANGAAAVAFPAAEVGFECVAVGAVAPRLQESPPDAGSDRSVNPDHGQSQEYASKGVVLHHSEAAIPAADLKGHTNYTAVVSEAAGRSDRNRRSRSDAVGRQDASAALGPRGVLDDTECREEPAVVVPREKQNDRVEQGAPVWLTCPSGIALQQADKRRVQDSAEQGHKPLGTEHRVAQVRSRERARELRCSCSEGETDSFSAGKRLFACKGFPREVSHCRGRGSFMHKRGEFSPAQVEYPAAVRRSFWVAWGYFGQVWLFGGQVELEVELRRGAALDEDGRVSIFLRCS
ncbi:hypothetical protein HPB48_003072 [Haemaphysalis longicornis]|uniref:Uncharacterized protein n=1 Tax=Haemaphysalis longicornis TaxID=44386 RepID=A0A9J6FH43_HAELO|nr:hypothetical protein HPB48_003072 [Haemaphysalis longicornis]